MIFSLEVLRARKGDCLLIHLGTKMDPGLVLIDGGPATVYAKHLKPRLKQIREARKLKPDQPLHLDMMMVSHVDDDHIHGLLDLTREEKTARDNGKKLLTVASFWHNSFDGIIRKVDTELEKNLKKQFGAASLKGGDLPESAMEEIEELVPEDRRELAETCLKVLANVKQGFQLRDRARVLKYPLNPEFNGALVMAPVEDDPTVVGGDKLALRVVGPWQPEIAELQKEHVEWLKEIKKKGKKPSDFLAAYVDESVANLSSIVAIAEAEGKTILLTGDARGDKIIEGLEKIGALSKAPNKPLEVNILKVPHHGSSNNLERNFFERIVADHYVFSGNGEHGNPERESLEMLMEARGSDTYAVHLTYSPGEIDKERKKDWDIHRNREKARGKKDVRPAWSPTKHSLVALLDDNKSFKKKVSHVKEGEPYLIELADPLNP